MSVDLSAEPVALAARIGDIASATIYTALVTVKFVLATFLFVRVVRAATRRPERLPGVVWRVFLGCVLLVWPYEIVLWWGTRPSKPPALDPVHMLDYASLYAIPALALAWLVLSLARVGQGQAGR